MHSYLNINIIEVRRTDYGAFALKIKGVDSAGQHKHRNQDSSN